MSYSTPKTAEPGLMTHVANRQLELGRAVMGRTRVYLGNCYWITLRDAELGRARDTQSQGLLESLRNGVARKSMICPISESVFLELLKQEDPDTRLATARLIDALSEGVALKPHPERVAAEVASFLRKCAGSETSEPTSIRVWTKAAYVLGVSTPSVIELPPEVRDDVSNAFFDYLWNTPVADIVARLVSLPLSSTDPNDLADRLNCGNSAAGSSLKSFQQTYRDEICGGMAIAAQLAVAIVENLARERSISVPIRSQQQREESERTYNNLLCNLIDRRKETALAFPTLHLSALCHAAIRWDKKRRLTPNDIYDFHHAEAAIPYCDVFLTERPLHMLLEQRRMGINDDFSCRIISSISEAAKWAQT